MPSDWLGFPPLQRPYLLSSHVQSSHVHMQTNESTLYALLANEGTLTHSAYQYLTRAHSNQSRPICIAYDPQPRPIYPSIHIGGEVKYIFFYYSSHDILRHGCTDSIPVEEYSLDDAS